MYIYNVYILFIQTSELKEYSTSSGFLKFSMLHIQMVILINPITENVVKTYPLNWELSQDQAETGHLDPLVNI